MANCHSQTDQLKVLNLSVPYNKMLIPAVVYAQQSSQHRHLSDSYPYSRQQYK